MDKFKVINLIRAKVGVEYTISEFFPISVADKRLADLGFVTGTKITVLGFAPFKTTMALMVRNSTICVRREQALKISVVGEK